MKKLLSITLAALTLTTATLTACSKSSEGDWRAEVTSVLSQVEANKPSITLPNANTTLPTAKLHPLTNADAGKVPSVSYGNSSHLIYGNKVYFSYQDGMNSINSWYYVDLSQLYSYDPLLDKLTQHVPQSMPLCMNPFCQHKTYQFNDGYVCPLYLDTHGENSVHYSHPIYCIDYTESKGAAPVFYILAAEPEYRIVGEQIVESVANDYAIYRYDSAVGKREIIAEDLPTSATSLTICGEYIYYYCDQGLVAINKKGEQVGSSDTVKEILGYENGKLYLSDVMGKVYTANKNLSNVKEVFTVDTSALTEEQIVDLIEDPNTPFGYRIVDGYLYYVNDYEKIYQSEKYEYNYVYVTSIYRVPLNNLSGEPELLLDRQCYLGQFYGAAGGKLYYIPAYNIKEDPYYLNGTALANVDLTTKEVTVMEENGFDVPWYKQSTLFSTFLIGASTQYSISYSFLTLYHFETGDIMYISMNALWGEVAQPE